MCCIAASKGVAYSIYIPEELVPQVRRCLENGRALQELLHEAAQRYANAVKHERTQRAEQKRADRSEPLDPQISFADLEFLRQSVQLDPVLQAISDFIDRPRAS